MSATYREGTIVKPYERMNQEQIRWIHQASLDILKDPGIWCYNEKAAKIFNEYGARVQEEIEYGQAVWRVSFPGGLVEETLKKVPSCITLGARDPKNSLLLDSQIPRVYFGTGSPIKEELLF